MGNKCSSQLYDACKNGNLEELRLAQEGSPKRKHKLPHEMTPLHIAAMYNHVDCVQYLLLSGAHANAQDKWGETALMKAVWFGTSHSECAQLLLQHGASLSPINKSGKDIYTMATDRANQVALELFKRQRVWNRRKGALLIRCPIPDLDPQKWFTSLPRVLCAHPTLLRLKRRRDRAARTHLFLCLLTREIFHQPDVIRIICSFL
jgi:ankyrin repeat protein